MINMDIIDTYVMELSEQDTVEGMIEVLEIYLSHADYYIETYGKDFFIILSIFLLKHLKVNWLKDERKW